MTMIILGALLIALSLYDYKKPNSPLSRVLKRLPGFKSDLENTQSNTAIAISTGVVFMMIGVIAKLLPFV